MNKKVLVMFVALIAMTMLATPVLAIGPFQAFQVGNNKNLSPMNGLSNRRGNAGGSIFLFWTATEQHWVRWIFQDASQAEGLMNNAMIAEYSGLPAGMTAYFLTLNSDENSNKWIYLSGDGGTNPSQYMGHGMLYWFVFGLNLLSGKTRTEAAANAAGIVAIYPNGEFWMHNDIFAPPL